MYFHIVTWLQNYKMVFVNHSETYVEKDQEPRGCHYYLAVWKEVAKIRYRSLFDFLKCLSPKTEQWLSGWGGGGITTKWYDRSFEGY